MVKGRKGWADPGTGGVDDLSDQDTEPSGLWPRCVGSVQSATARKAWLGAGAYVRRRWAALRTLCIVFASGPGSRVKVACG